MCGEKTIDRVGVCTVNMRTPSGSADSKCVTVASCLMASGSQMKAMVIFKGKSKYNRYCYVLGSSNHFPCEMTGKPNGTIARRELPMLCKELTYHCQEKAWFDEQVMVDWVNEILAPYVCPRRVDNSSPEVKNEWK